MNHKSLNGRTTKCVRINGHYTPIQAITPMMIAFWLAEQNKLVKKGK